MCLLVSSIFERNNLVTNDTDRIKIENQIFINFSYLTESISNCLSKFKFMNRSNPETFQLISKILNNQKLLLSAKNKNKWFNSILENLKENQNYFLDLYDLFRLVVFARIPQNYDFQMIISQNKDLLEQLNLFRTNRKLDRDEFFSQKTNSKDVKENLIYKSMNFDNHNNNNNNKIEIYTVNKKRSKSVGYKTNTVHKNNDNETDYILKKAISSND